MDEVVISLKPNEAEILKHLLRKTIRVAAKNSWNYIVSDELHSILDKLNKVEQEKENWQLQ